MTQIVQLGQINPAGLVVPDAFVQIVPPQNQIITGAPTNICGVVGTASWGPVNTPITLGGNNDALANFGPVMNRLNDIGTAVAIGVQQFANNFRAVRVTDNTDTAALAVITASGTAITIASKWTGSLGNLIKFTLAAGGALSTTKATVAMPNLNPEVYDNISGGVVSNAVTPGTGATAVPPLSFSAPQLAGGIQAQGNASLLIVGVPTVGAGGSGYAVNDTITLANGIVLKVATLSTSAVATVTVLNAGSLLSGSTPTNPAPQTSTSGTGTGATFNLVWGLGPVTMTQQGTGYTSATVTQGAGGGSGTITPATAIWQNLANAINNGQSGIRGPSNIVVATAGSAVGAPTNATTPLAGGSDGVANITSATLIGVDVTPRKGMFALRGQGCSVVNLVDLFDTTQFSAAAQFGLSESCFVGVTTPSGDTISNAQTELSTAGVDSYALKVIFGDWIYWQDQVNGVLRLVSPVSFWAGERTALSPQNSTLNKQLFGVVGTQKSFTGATYSSAELQTIISSRMDVVANPEPGGAIFGMRAGRNCSSNPAIRGENYTMMTNFLALSLAGAIGAIIGMLQTPTQRRQAKAMFDNFFAGLAQLGLIGNADGTTPWQTVLNASNNPAPLVAQGIEQVAIKVVYLSVIEYLLVNLEGGQTVTIDKVTTTLNQQAA